MSGKYAAIQILQTHIKKKRGNKLPLEIYNRRPYFPEIKATLQNLIDRILLTAGKIKYADVQNTRPNRHMENTNAQKTQQRKNKGNATLGAPENPKNKNIKQSQAQK